MILLARMAKANRLRRAFVIQCNALIFVSAPIIIRQRHVICKTREPVNYRRIRITFFQIRVIKFYEINPPNVGIRFVRIARMAPMRITNVFIRQIMEVYAQFQEPYLGFRRNSRLIRFLRLINP